MRTLTTMAGLAVAGAATILLSGCQYDSSATAPTSDTDYHLTVPDVPTPDVPDVAEVAVPDAGSDTPFTDPYKAELYREMTGPMTYEGGDPDSPCGGWGSNDAAGAREMAAAYAQCMAKGGR